MGGNYISNSNNINYNITEKGIFLSNLFDNNCLNAQDFPIIAKLNSKIINYQNKILSDYFIIESINYNKHMCYCYPVQKREYFEKILYGKNKENLSNLEYDNVLIINDRGFDHFHSMTFPIFIFYILRKYNNFKNDYYKINNLYIRASDKEFATLISDYSQLEIDILKLLSSSGYISSLRRYTYIKTMENGANYFEEYPI